MIVAFVPDWPDGRFELQLPGLMPKVLFADTAKSIIGCEQEIDGATTSEMLTLSSAKHDAEDNNNSAGKYLNTRNRNSR